jgi:hypothetical protein
MRFLRQRRPEAGELPVVRPMLEDQRVLRQVGRPIDDEGSQPAPRFDEPFPRQSIERLLNRSPGASSPVMMALRRVWMIRSCCGRGRSGRFVMVGSITVLIDFMD